MSTRNDGISRFEASTVYAPVTFTSPVTFPGGVGGGAIVCTTLTASGAIAGLSVAATNALTGASLAVVGAIGGGSAAIVGQLSSATMQCASYSSLAASMTLNSAVGLFLTGTLDSQDGANANAPAALVLADIPFNASYLVSAPRAFVLPDTLLGTMPQGVRMTFLVPNNVAVTFQSPTREIINIRNLNGALQYVVIAAGAGLTPNNAGGDVFYQVTSVNDRWLVMSFAV